MTDLHVESAVTTPNPSLPVYEPAQGRNIFRWIIRTAQAIRAEREGETRIERRTRELLAQISEPR